MSRPLVIYTNQRANVSRMLPLTSQQCAVLQKDYHIYLVPNGRITIPGINSGNVEYVAKSIDSVVRGA